MLFFVHFYIHILDFLKNKDNIIYGIFCVGVGTPFDDGGYPVAAPCPALTTFLRAGAATQLLSSGKTVRRLRSREFPGPSHSISPGCHPAGERPCVGTLLRVDGAGALPNLLRFENVQSTSDFLSKN